MIGPTSSYPTCSHLSPSGGDAAHQEGGANRHGQGFYGAAGSVEVDALSERFQGGVKELALDSDCLLLGTLIASARVPWAVFAWSAGTGPKDFMLGHAGRDC